MILFSNMRSSLQSQVEGLWAIWLTHLMSVQNSKNDEFLSAPKEKRGNRGVVYHALGTHLVQEATPELPSGLHWGVWIRTEGSLSICVDVSLTLIVEGNTKHLYRFTQAFDDGITVTSGVVIFQVLLFIHFYIFLEKSPNLRSNFICRLENSQGKKDLHYGPQRPRESWEPCMMIIGNFGI